MFVQHDNGNFIEFSLSTQTWRVIKLSRLSHYKDNISSNYLVTTPHSSNPTPRICSWTIYSFQASWDTVKREINLKLACSQVCCLYQSSLLLFSLTSLFLQLSLLHFIASSGFNILLLCLQCIYHKWSLTYLWLGLGAFYSSKVQS